MSRIGVILLIPICLVVEIASVIGIAIFAMEKMYIPMAACIILSIICGFAFVKCIKIVQEGVKKLKEEALKKQGGTRVGDFVSDLPQIREVVGQPYQVLFRKAVPGKNGRPADLAISVNAAVPTTMTFNEETWFDRWSKRMGIAHEHQTGDAEFDDAIFIRCPSNSYVEEFLKEPVRRVAILALRNLGYTEIRITGTEIVAYWANFDPLKNGEADLQDRTGQILLKLAEDLPQQIDTELVEKQSHSLGVGKTLLWTFQIVFAVAFILTFTHPAMRESKILLAALMAILPVMFVYGWLCAFAVRGTSTSHDKWKAMMLVAMFTMPLGTLGTLSGINALLDSKPAVTHSQVVVNKRFSTGKNNSKTYYAVVAAWDNPNDTFEFRVNSADYNRIQIGISRMDLTVKPGKLGIEWLVKKSVKLNAPRAIRPRK
ncbi:MAG: hypothetical protein R3B84_23155 [Zavarzinella sp.]